MNAQAVSNQAGSAEAEWTVDDVVRSIRPRDEAPSHARRWVVALAAIVVAGAAMVAAAGMSTAPRAAVSAPAALPSRIAAMAWHRAAAPAAAPVALPSRIAASAGRSGPLPARRRSVIVLLPAESDYLAASSIPVAGIAVGSPHGARVRSVHVELFVAGRRVARTTLAVYAGRFAGVLRLATAVDRADAELRFSNPDNPAQAAVVRPVTLDGSATNARR